MEFNSLVRPEAIFEAAEDIPEILFLATVLQGLEDLRKSPDSTAYADAHSFLTSDEVLGLADLYDFNLERWSALAKRTAKPHSRNGSRMRNPELLNDPEYRSYMKGRTPAQYRARAREQYHASKAALIQDTSKPSTSRACPRKTNGTM